MRQPASRFIVFVLALFVGLAAPRVSFADVRSDARAHYQAGQKAYAAADYRTAIKEFSAAQSLLPADLNNYNLALCYDKLGEAEPAIQYYREYLNKVPNADKRTEIEASIARLEAALKSASAKRAEEARAEEARKAEEARRAAEEARRAEEAKRAAQTSDPYAPGPSAGAGAGVGVGVGSTGTPGTGQAISTGDAQLDRVSSIDVNSVRDQRVGGAGSGMPDNRGGPATMGAGVGAGAGVAAGPQAPQGGQAQGALAPTDQPPKKPTPVYKKWWFWAVVAVSAYVVYSIASEGSSGNTARELPPMPGPANQSTGGATLLRF